MQVTCDSFTAFRINPACKCKVFNFIFLIAVFLSGCQEIYTPDVDSKFEVLAVDGLLTDMAEPYSIRLKMARQFDSTGIGIPVSDALITVIDDLDQFYAFKKAGRGNYIPVDTFFSVTPERFYTLRVQTPDGSQYESSVQQLIPNKNIDNIYGLLATKTYLSKNHYGETVRKDYEGIETYVDFIESAPGQFLAFKFNVRLLIEFTYISAYKKYYAWRNWNLNEDINITENQYQIINNQIIAHPLPFIPLEQEYYSLNPNLWFENIHIVKLILIIDQFRLNKDTYNFYSNIRQQLNAEGKLFDPIATQIYGNIRCTNDPRKLVLGNFEVSSKKTVTYVVTQENLSNTMIYSIIPNLLNISDEGSSTSPPDWWFY